MASKQTTLSLASWLSVMMKRNKEEKLVSIAEEISRPLVIVFTLAFVFPAPMCAGCQLKKSAQEEESALKLSVKSVAENPEKYFRKIVRLSGRLENQGKNYFTDLRIALRDDEGNYVYVRPWVPYELPPSPPGHTDRKPPVLSQYLGKTVELTGVLDRGTLKKVGEVYLLVVRTAKVVK